MLRKNIYLLNQKHKLCNNNFQNVTFTRTTFIYHKTWLSWSIILVISVVFKMERKSSLRQSSNFSLSKITEAILEKITVRGIFQTQLHIEIHKLYWTSKHQVRKWHCLRYIIYEKIYKMAIRLTSTLVYSNQHFWKPIQECTFHWSNQRVSRVSSKDLLEKSGWNFSRDN